MLALGLVCLAGAAISLLRYAVVFPRQPLDTPTPPPSLEELALAQRLERHVRAVASVPHNVEHPAALEAAARYIEAEIAQLGLKSVPHAYQVDGVDVRNIEIVIEPATPAGDLPCYVIGAHYDAPDDIPGANDNGSGTAALLELARLLAPTPLRHARQRLVFFVNEEQPYGKSEAMGSWQYARNLAEQHEPVAGMIALETLGYFSDIPGSQRLPKPFGLIYPHTGNFVAFVALPGGRRLLHAAIGAFRRHTAFPSVGGLAPGFIEGIDLSDHWSFKQFGYPALMVTDTALYRNPHYHELTDTPENVDYPSLARITLGLAAMMRELTERGN